MPRYRPGWRPLAFCGSVLLLAPKAPREDDAEYDDGFRGRERFRAGWEITCLFMLTHYREVDADNNILLELPGFVSVFLIFPDRPALC
jgi:hypothetical protein